MTVVFTSEPQYLEAFAYLDASGVAYALANPPTFGYEELDLIHTTVTTINDSGVTSVMDTQDITNLVNEINNISGLSLIPEDLTLSSLSISGGSSNLVLGTDVSGVFRLAQTGAGGYMAYMPNANVAQMMWGAPGGGALGFLDVEDGGTLNLNILQNGPVVISEGGLYPENDGLADLGTSSNGWGTAHIDTLNVNTLNVSGGVPINALSNVNISSPSNGDFLRFDGSDWVNDVLSYAEYHMQTNTTNTTFSATNTPTKVLGTTTAGDNSNFSHSNNRATYTGTTTKRIHVTAALSARRQGGSNFDCNFYVAKNGSVITKSLEQRQITNAEGSIFIQCLETVSNGDFIEMWVENIANTSPLRVEFLNVIIRCL